MLAGELLGSALWVCATQQKVYLLGVGWWLEDSSASSCTSEVYHCIRMSCVLCAATLQAQLVSLFWYAGMAQTGVCMAAQQKGLLFFSSFWQLPAQEAILWDQHAGNWVLNPQCWLRPRMPLYSVINEFSLTYVCMFALCVTKARSLWYGRERNFPAIVGKEQGPSGRLRREEVDLDVNNRPMLMLSNIPRDRCWWLSPSEASLLVLTPSFSGKNCLGKSSR